LQAKERVKNQKPSLALAREGGRAKQSPGESIERAIFKFLLLILD